VTADPPHLVTPPQRRGCCRLFKHTNCHRDIRFALPIAGRDPCAGLPQYSPPLLGLPETAGGLHRHWGVCAEADAHALTLCKADATFPSCTRRCRCITRCARPGSRFSRVRRRAKHLPPGGVHAHSRTVAISSVARRAGIPPDVTKPAPSVAPGMVGIRKVVSTNSGGAGPDRIQRPAA
jgi:hypothetical protein